MTKQQQKDFGFFCAFCGREDAFLVPRPRSCESSIMGGTVKEIPRTGVTASFDPEAASILLIGTEGEQGEAIRLIDRHLSPDSLGDTVTPAGCGPFSSGGDR